MTALAEALLAAQRQAIGALSKAYVAGAFDEREDFLQALSSIGATDRVDQEQLHRCLDVLQTYGAPAPAATLPPREETKPAALVAGVWQTGKHKGQTLAETPYDYLQWYAEKGPDDAAREAARVAMQQRDEVPF